MQKKLILGLCAFIFFIAGSLVVYGADRLEGAYPGTQGQGHDEVAYNFLKHFSYEQYYWGYGHQWTWNNNARVDAVNFAFFAGHGNRWLIQLLDGNIDLSTAGNNSNNGYGLNCDFVAFESCKVIPSVIDVTDWWTPWVNEPGGVFDGLHQAVGFRTDSYQSSDQNISDYFGTLVSQGQGIWQSWFAAINKYGVNGEKGSAVMHPDHQNDTYSNPGADPPDDGSLTVWYQY